MKIKFDVGYNLMPQDGSGLKFDVWARACGFMATHAIFENELCDSKKLESEKTYWRASLQKDVKMKTDMIGDYNENEIPRGLVLPIKVDKQNEGICGSDNRVVANFLVSREITARGHAMRRGDFLCRLVNGDIMVHEGTVYLKTSSSKDGDTVTVKYGKVKK